MAAVRVHVHYSSNRSWVLHPRALGEEPAAESGSRPMSQAGPATPRGSRASPWLPATACRAKCIFILQKHTMWSKGRSSPHARQWTMWPTRAPRATGPVTERGADNGCSRRNLGNVMLSERRWSQKAAWHTSPPLNVHRRDTPGDGEPSGGAGPGGRAGEVTGWGLCVS